MIKVYREVHTMAPIVYIPEFVPAPAEKAEQLLVELPWIHAGETVPRKEYYHHAAGKPYTYGGGQYARMYQSQPLHPVIDEINKQISSYLNCVFDVIFVNLYEHQHHFLGWHADDSPEMSDDHPIVTISLGSEREIWFRRNGYKDVSKLLLENGSACIMLPGMQDTHQHRIPKHSQPCGPRISLTFRKFVEVESNGN